MPRKYYTERRFSVALVLTEHLGQVRPFGCGANYLRDAGQMQSKTLYSIPNNT